MGSYVCACERTYVLIYSGFGLDMARGHMKGEPKDSRTQSRKFASWDN